MYGITSSQVTLYKTKTTVNTIRYKSFFKERQLFADRNLSIYITLDKTLFFI